MNKDNVKEYKHIFDALMNGKTIQIKSSAYPGAWEDIEDVCFLDKPEMYRVKPNLMDNVLEKAEWMQSKTHTIRRIINDCRMNPGSVNVVLSQSMFTFKTELTRDYETIPYWLAPFVYVSANNSSYYLKFSNDSVIYIASENDERNLRGIGMIDNIYHYSGLLKDYSNALEAALPAIKPECKFILTA